MKYQTRLVSLKEYLSGSANVLDEVKKVPYQVKKSMGNIKNKVPIYAEWNLAVVSGVFSINSLLVGASYFVPRNNSVQGVSSGNPYLDILIGLGLLGAAATLAHHLPTE